MKYYNKRLSLKQLLRNIQSLFYDFIVNLTFGQINSLKYHNKSETVIKLSI